MYVLAEYTSNWPYPARVRQRAPPRRSKYTADRAWAPVDSTREGLVYVTYTRQALGGTYALSVLAATGITAWGGFILRPVDEEASYHIYVTPVRRATRLPYLP